MTVALKLLSLLKSGACCELGDWLSPARIRLPLRFSLRRERPDLKHFQWRMVVPVGAGRVWREDMWGPRLCGSRTDRPSPPGRGSAARGTRSPLPVALLNVSDHRLPPPLVGREPERWFQFQVLGPMRKCLLQLILRSVSRCNPQNHLKS